MSSQIRNHQTWAFPGFLSRLHFIRRIPIPLSDCTQRSWFTILTFYALISYEMLSKTFPLMAYLRRIFNPGLDILLGHPVLAWLNSCFLPRSIETFSGSIKHPNWLGALLITGGMLLFGVGAAQLSTNKQARAGVVTGGIYHCVRHPQYTGLAVCGLGMLVLWPRYTVLITFIAMLFGYYCLGRIEEHACKQKFG